MNNKTDLIKLSGMIRNIHDFPKDGIQFKDITPLLGSSESFHLLSEMILDKYKNKGITKVIGIESRGFIVASVLAFGLNAGFIPIRKSGKLPAKVAEIKYKKEYGYDTIQIHEDSLNKDDVVLIHDDLLATGGTMLAAYELVNRIGVKQIYINYIIELKSLKGRNQFPEGIDMNALLILD